LGEIGFTDLPPVLTIKSPVHIIAVDDLPDFLDQFTGVRVARGDGLGGRPTGTQKSNQDQTGSEVVGTHGKENYSFYNIVSRLGS